MSDHKTGHKSYRKRSLFLVGRSNDLKQIFTFFHLLTFVLQVAVSLPFLMGHPQWDTKPHYLTHQLTMFSMDPHNYGTTKVGKDYLFLTTASDYVSNTFYYRFSTYLPKSAIYFSTIHFWFIITGRYDHHLVSKWSIVKIDSSWHVRKKKSYY